MTRGAGRPRGCAPHAAALAVAACGLAACQVPGPRRLEQVYGGLEGASRAQAVARLGGDRYRCDPIGPGLTCVRDFATFRSCIARVNLEIDPSTRRVVRLRYGRSCAGL